MKVKPISADLTMDFSCQFCKYFDSIPNHSRDIKCAVNPKYASAWQHKKLSNIEEKCWHFELNPVRLEKESDSWCGLPDSELIDAVAYANKTLKIRFSAGAVHQYDSVPFDVFYNLIILPSDDFFKRKVQDCYTYIQI